jgi:FlaA1/EpsC-like NDP-sugar epimerase
VGLRAGEKVHEELFGDGEVDTRPKHPLISHVPVIPIKTEILLADPKDAKTFMIEVSSS